VTSLMYTHHALFSRLLFSLVVNIHTSSYTDVIIWIVFKVAVQTYRALHDDAPQYLRQFTSVADIPTRQILRSSTSDDLCVPAVRRPTVGRRAVSVACARVWNALPVDVTSAPSLFTFRKRLKLHLFSLSYPGRLAWSTKLTFSPCVVLVVAFCYLGHPKKIY